MSKIKTRILIISDTHGTSPVLPSSPTDDDDDFATADLRTVITGYRHPLPAADVVLHCGDLTKRGTLPEFKATFSKLRGLQAPSKLVIAGNHDSLLDPAFDLDGEDDSEADDQVEHLGRLIKDAEQDGVRYLTEGTHDFTLQNGAALKVYASPYTPSYGAWAFQYSGDHEFAIPRGVDVAMTHGPPYGILDEAGVGQYVAAGRQPEHAGCKHLFGAVARARPRIHCFGHIHEAWGAYHCAWAADGAALANTAFLPRREDVVDGSKSRVLHTIGELKPMTRADASMPSPEARKMLSGLSRQRGVKLDLTDERTMVEPGKHTLFLNAAIMDIRYRPSQLPWIIDIDLPQAQRDVPAGRR
ncbi:hypothetical protein EsDP_00004021 [Epichloe bromicola]|uniref:Calcineurin-like phosphoesterase domain-containing protein n=1 Tax=Epichloe bromicola TaxID=79588 RepID=A0ABQ0CQH1_9HYPO